MNTQGTNLVSAAYNQTIKSLQLPEGQNIYWDIQNQFVLFNEYNQIYDHRVFVNGALLLQYYPSIVAPNITKTCYILQDYCLGPLQQFADFDACVAFMNTLPLLKGFTAQPVGANDAGCRSFHASLIPPFSYENPGQFNPHCFHSGPFNAAITMGAAGLFVTPCIDETGPFNPLPAAPTSRHVARDEDEDEQGVLQPCASENCRYARVRQQGQKLFWYQVGFSQAQEALIPAVAAILDQN